MAKVDRPHVVELLDRLGAEDDETVVQAARELHRMVSESGLSWDDLLRVESDVATGRDAERQEQPVDVAESDDAEQVGSTPDQAETVRLIERLLARKSLSETLREDLTEMKRNIADGSFDAAMDGRYIQALAKRLGA